MKAVKVSLMKGIQIQKPLYGQYRTVLNRSKDFARQKQSNLVHHHQRHNSHHNNYRYYSSWGTHEQTKLFQAAVSPVVKTSLFGFGLFLAFGMAAWAESSEEEEENKKIVESAGARKEGLPVFTKAEVAKHKSLDTGIWVTFRNGVYDITEFVEQHPGGNTKILLAAGGSIDPFWKLFAQHMEANVVEILESLRIGNLREEDVLLNMKELSKDPYADEPTNRDPHLIVRSHKPFNAETPPEFLAERLITPTEHFYIRNHLPVPVIDSTNYAVEITGDGMKPIRLTLDQLKTLFPKKSVVTTIQCAGNRRNEMTKIKSVKGGSWDIGAISTAEWTGVSLRDVLLHAGLNPDGSGMKHIHFNGLDKDFEKQYGASIPIDKALNPSGDVILAFQMNGKDIPLDHGFPIRAVVPGVVGARNVKWLSKIHASKNESQNHWQQLDYKGFSPSIDWHNVDFSKAPAIQDLPVVSAIALPKDGTVLPKDTKDLTIKGYAWSGGGRGIVRVDVSIDGGKNWQVADLEQLPQPEGRQWAWSLWKLNVPVPTESDGKLDIVCKAVDTSYNNQPERVEPIWNLRGVLNNAWHHVHVVVPVNKQDNKK